MTTPATNTNPQRPHGAGGFYAVAAMGTAISADTSWRFFGTVLHIANPERVAMFAVLEAAFLACGWATRANVRRPNGTPGAARTLALVLCGLSAYMAVVLSGPLAGLARVALGPVLALVCLHLALGIEIRVRRTAKTGTAERIWSELRERLLSRLGLGDDRRDALARSRDRAADRAARLAVKIGRRDRRLARALAASGAALDPARRDRVVAQVAVARHLDDIRQGCWPEVPVLTGWIVPPEVADDDAPELPVRASARKQPGTSRRNNTRKSASAQSRRPAEETRQLAAELRAAKPGLTQPELAKLLGITDRQLRNVERRANGQPNPELLPAGSTS